MTDQSTIPDAYQPRQRLPFAMVPRTLVESDTANPYVVAVYAALSARSNKDDVTWPSYDLLVKEAHQSRARLSKSLKWLEANGWITVTRGSDPSGHRLANIYTLHESPSLSSPGELGPEFTTGAPEFTGETSSGELEQEPLELEPENKNHLAKQVHDSIWDTAVELYGQPSNGQRSLHAKLVNELAANGATPDEMRRRSVLLVDEWGKKAATFPSLAKWWSRYDSLVGQVTDTDVDAAARAETRRERRDKMMAGIAALEPADPDSPQEQGRRRSRR